MDVAIVWYAAVACLVMWMLRKKYEKYASMCASVRCLPGYKRYPLIGTAYKLINAKTTDVMNFIDSDARLHGSTTVRWDAFIPVVHTYDPGLVEAIFNSTANIDKGWGYGFLHPWLGSGLLTSSGRKWQIHRKIIMPAFHFQILESFVQVFAENSKILVNQLEKQLNNQKGFDVCPYFSLCTLDIICETAMGVKLESQSNSYSPFVSAVHSLAGMTIERGMKPWIYLDFIFYLTEVGRKYRKSLAVVHSFSNEVIRERKETFDADMRADMDSDYIAGKKNRKAFLDLLLEFSASGSFLTDEEIRQEVDTFMFEGHDTTSAALNWTVYVLGRYPDVQDRVYEELTNIFGGSNREPTTKDLAEMKYLERVMKETLRLYPSVPFISRTIAEEIKVGKYSLAAGLEVWINIYQIHRNPKYFPNPEEFNPDNFLPERTQGRNPFAYVPFSAGSRNCIGQKFALLEVKVVLSTLLRNYKITSLDKLEDINLAMELVLKPEKGIQITLEQR